MRTVNHLMQIRCRGETGTTIQSCDVLKPCLEASLYFAELRFFDDVA